jgi:hypothetical protein
MLAIVITFRQEANAGSIKINILLFLCLSLSLFYLHSINPKQVSTFGYRTSQRVTYISLLVQIITYDFAFELSSHR